MEWTAILGYVGPGAGGAISVLWAVNRFVIRPLREENAEWREVFTNHLSEMTAAQHDTASILRDLVAKVSKINGKLG